MKHFIILLSFLVCSNFLFAQSTIKRDISKDERRVRTAVKYRAKVITTYQGISLEDLADMGYNYFWGENGIQKNQSKGMDMLVYASNKGSCDAFANLGDIYSDSESGRIDVNKAIYYYDKGVKKGDVECINGMALLYYSGDVIQPDYTKAKYYFELGDKKGSSACTYYLAQIYANGLGVELDLEHAFALYNKASNDGMLLADLDMGKMYLFGQGIQTDYNKAYSLFYKVADTWHLPEAIYWLARMTEDGLGCQKNKEQALQWYNILKNSGFTVTEDINRINQK